MGAVGAQVGRVLGHGARILRFAALGKRQLARVRARSNRLRASTPDPQDDVIVEGARTTAAMAASRFGPVLKVSEDGAMTFYDGQRIWDL